MKLYFGVFCMSLLLISCHSGMHDKPIQIQPTLSPCLEEAFSWFIGDEEHPDTACFYSISFHKDNEEFCVWDDTLILIGKPNKLFPKEGFKGCATIGDFKLLIFDNQNLGSLFFNQDSLKCIDIDSIILSDTAFFLDVIVDDTVLLPRGCCGDGLAPFRINSKHYTPQN